MFIRLGTIYHIYVEVTGIIMQYYHNVNDYTNIVDYRSFVDIILVVLDKISHQN